MGGFLSGSAPSPMGACSRQSSAIELCARYDGLRERSRSGAFEEPQTFGSVRDDASDRRAWSAAFLRIRGRPPGRAVLTVRRQPAPPLGDEEASAVRRSCSGVGLTTCNRTRRLEGAAQAASLPRTGTRPFGVAFHRAAPRADPAFGPERRLDLEPGTGLRATKGSGGRCSTSGLPARDESSRRRPVAGTPGALVGWNMPTRALEGVSP